jgi:hypothetical protein
MTDPAKEQRFLTQTELAKRWRMSQSCVKNWRDRGHLPYFRLPGSTRILYPVDAIEEVEKLHTTQAREVVTPGKGSEIKRRKPVVSSKQDENWRI